MTSVTSPRLSPREIELLKLLIAGQSNKELAKSMNVSSATVKQYLRMLFLKFSVSNRTQLAVLALMAFGETPTECADLSRVAVNGALKPRTVA
jgi:DNA-binding CsgD family transcriptional regulator